MCDKGNPFDDMRKESIPYERKENFDRMLYDLATEVQRLHCLIRELQFELRMKEQEVNDAYDKMSFMAEIPKRKVDKKKLRNYFDMVERRRIIKSYSNRRLVDIFEQPYIRGKGWADDFGVRNEYENYGRNRKPQYTLIQQLLSEKDGWYNDGR